MITKIENALVERLSRGLGKLVNTVKSYGGELDDNSLAVVRLPMCLVTFGGSHIERMGTSCKRYQSTATFVVIVAVRSLKSNLASRQGGADVREVGANQLISAVRRLLDSQTLGGLIKPLKPKRVQPLFNNAEFKSERLTAYAIEFEAVFDDLSPLDEGRFPEPTQDSQSADFIFNQYQGELSEAEPDFLRVSAEIYDPTNQAKVPLSLSLGEQDESESSHGD